MKPSFPTDRVPNLQSFPENGYPIEAYYGVDSSLPTMQVGTASSSSKTGIVNSPTDRKRLAFVVLFLVVGAYAMFHFYNK